MLRILATLPRLSRQVYILSEILGYTDEVVMQRLGIDTNTIDEHLIYAREKMAAAED